MIIALAGRKQSGKTLLAKVAEKHGFERLSFASSLKDVISKLLNINEEDMLNLKEKVINFSFTSEKIDQLSLFTGLSIKDLNPICLGKTILTGREFMQFLGTEVIRRLNPNWHVEQLEKKLGNGNYIVDDLRFGNEKNLLEKKGALLFFIIRPRQFEYDHHESETSLRWHDFDDWIVNNCKTDRMITRQFGIFIKTMLRPFCSLRKNRGKMDTLAFRNSIKKDFRENGAAFIKKKYKWCTDSVNLWLFKLFIYRDREVFSFDNLAFAKPTQESSYFAGLLAADGCVKDNSVNSNVALSLSLTDKCLVDSYKAFLQTEKTITTRYRGDYKDCHDISTTNAFILENIKLWNLKPRKSEKEEIPWIIQDNVEMLKAWIVGLIDGDGTICFGRPNNKKWPNLKPSLRVQVLSSVEVSNFIQNLVPIKSTIRKHKDTDLMEVCFYNHYAIDFFNWLGRPSFGLERKWLKIKEFEEINTSRRTPKNDFSN